LKTIFIPAGSDLFDSHRTERKGKFSSSSEDLKAIDLSPPLTD